ncbi:MAG TPA: helix-turn-helix domain-containing protein, partial [Candidatus Acidoferrum sp.]|nr:helix-turn-helix domain-containing protein [Candidatus Acidoferrum sp.]
TGPRISVTALPEKIVRASQAPAHEAAASNGKILIPPEGLNLEQRIQEMEKAYLLEALRLSDGVGTRAAELLKMTYRSFRHYSKKYGI